MEIREFVEGYKRMCDSYDDCEECLLYGKYCHIDELSEDDIQKIKQWIEEHPIKTNAQKFKEVFGVEPKADDEYIECCFIRTGEECQVISCTECEKWWDEEYKEPKAGDNE